MEIESLVFWRDAIILCICTVLYGRTSLASLNPFIIILLFSPCLLRSQVFYTRPFMKKTFKFLSDHNLTCKLLSYIFKYLLDIFTPKESQHHGSVKRRKWFGSKMNCGCMRGYHSVLQRNIVTTHWPSSEGTRGRSTPTFLSSHLVITQMEAQPTFRISSCMPCFTARISKSSRLNTLVLHVTLFSPFSTSSQCNI